jgi:hypothetical protein
MLAIGSDGIIGLYIMNQVVDEFALVREFRRSR